MSEPLFHRVTVIGLGLIGSSLMQAVRRHDLVTEIIGCDSSEAVREMVETMGIADRVEADPARAVQGADLIVLATPVGAFGAVARQMGSTIAAGAIVTDVGSVKQLVATAVGPHLPEGAHLVPSHPVAGTEHSGPEAGFPELFQNRWCILTPAAGVDAKAVARLSELWRRVGSDVELMEPTHHDKVLAITSHLPHLIAYTIVATAADLEGQLTAEAREEADRVTTAEVIKYSAGGFRDFTRIAASDPVMWRDVFLHNKEAVLEMLGRFTEDLTALQRAIRWGEGDTLHELFTRTRTLRRGVLDARQAGSFAATEPSASESPAESAAAPVPKSPDAAR